MEAGIQEVETYVSHCQNTVAQYIANRPIMYLSLVVEQRPGTRVPNWWWKQYCLYLEVMWVDP